MTGRWDVLHGRRGVLADDVRYVAQGAEALRVFVPCVGPYEEA
jgi:hypothetical protein